jgi:hypothetical protein
MNRVISIITGFLLLAISGGASLAQDNARAPANPNAAQAQTDEQTSAKQFDDLRHSRIGTVNAISKLNQTRQAEEQLLSSTQDQEKLLEKRLSSLGDDSPPSAEDYAARLDDLKSQKENVSAALSAAKAATPTDQNAIDTLTGRLSQINKFIDDNEYRMKAADKETQQYKVQKDDLTSQLNTAKSDIATIKSNIFQTQNNIDKDTQDLQEIEDQLAVLFTKSDQTNSFKLNMSLAFTGLVSLVIIGFFFVALYDEKVRTSIFSNESGIQFITLFSLVIAIILFGIVNILEGRELAALLGGLSGYILGRGTGTERTSTQETSRAATQYASSPTPVAPHVATS